MRDLLEPRRRCGLSNECARERGAFDFDLIHNIFEPAHFENLLRQLTLADELFSELLLLERQLAENVWTNELIDAKNKNTNIENHLIITISN